MTLVSADCFPGQKKNLQHKEHKDIVSTHVFVFSKKLYIFGPAWPFLRTPIVFDLWGEKATYFGALHLVQARGNDLGQLETIHHEKAGWICFLVAQGQIYRLSQALDTLFIFVEQTHFLGLLQVCQTGSPIACPRWPVFYNKTFTFK